MFHDNERNDAKFEKELICCFKIDIRNLTNFDWSTQTSQNFHFDWFPLVETI